jgi:predicted PurR-regulated permease PerM
MTMGEQARWWSIAFVAVLLFIWTFSSAITPFLAGMALAYFLDPIADRLEAMGASRLLATVVVAGAALTATLLALLLVGPLIIGQAADLVRAAPEYLRTAQEFISSVIAERAPGALDETGVLRDAFDAFCQRMQEFSVTLVEGVFSGALTLIDFLSLAVITPVVTFYMLLDWDRMVDEIDHWLPRRHAPIIRRLAGDVDRVLAGFVRGQFTVCLILGAFYAVMLVALGLNFGLVVGLFAGLVSFIPFVGSLLGGALSIGIALVQFWGDWLMIVAVAGVFAVGQAVEGNYLTPKLVGGSVGLHPVWLMFALACFGAVMGFTGLLIAVPAAASIGVLVRFALEQYRAGRLYTGGEALVPDDPDHERDP